MINTVDPFGHKHGLLLIGHGVPVFPGDVAEPRNHPKALRDLAVHGSIHVVEEVQSLRYQFVPFRNGARLDLVLARCVEIVGV